MIKICIDARMIDSSGIGRYLKNVLINLDSYKFDIHLIVYPKDRLHRDLGDFQKKVYFSPSIYTVKEQLLFPSMIPKKCDIFWSPHFNVPLLPIRAKKRVVTIHDLYHFEYLDDLTWREKIYAKYVITSVIKKSDRVITVSNFSAMEIKKYFPNQSSKISVIHNGIDKEMFQSMDLKVKKIRDRYKDFPVKYFLFVGNFKIHKNLKNLIKAFEYFCDQIKEDIFLVIVGSNKGLRNSEDISLLIKNMKYRNRLYILDSARDEELSSIYSEAISLVFPSFYEGFGFPPLEAMCCKIPVIASDRASISEICGKAAYYIDPNNPKQISQAMIDMFCKKDKKEKYVALGSIQKEKYCWKKSTKMHEKVFEELVSENSNSS